MSMTNPLDGNGLQRFFNGLKLLFAPKKAGVYVVKGTQTATTASWTGNIDIDALYDGLTIAYYLPRTAASNVTLNLTLSGGGTTGAIPVYYTGTSRMNTHYAAGSTIYLTYWSAGSISVNGTPTTEDRWTASDYYYAAAHSIYTDTAITAKSTITAGTLICGDADGYQTIANGVSFDIAYPVLYRGNSISLNQTRSDLYISTRFNFTPTNGGTSPNFTLYKAVWLKGKLTGSVFTVDNTTMWTQTIPATEDEYQYYYLGYAYSVTNLRMMLEHPIFEYSGGKWHPYSELQDSGVSAGSYGPSTNATPAFGATFNVPYVTVDAKGRLTAASTKTVKIPDAPTIPSASTSNPVMDGTASPGSSTAWARGDHIHPSDTTKLSLTGGTMTGDLILPTTAHVISALNRGANYIHTPEGGCFFTVTSTTGRLKITLPVSWSATFVKFTVNVFKYGDDKSAEYHVAGYNYSEASGGWTKTTAYCTGKYPGFSNLDVIFGHDGTKSAIWIGNADTPWQYTMVQITDLTVGWSNFEIDTWSSGWNITVDSTDPSFISRTITNTHVGYGLPAEFITSGTLPVGRGGTGQTSFTSGSYLVGNGTSGISIKKPAAVLTDIGAASATDVTQIQTQLGTHTVQTDVPANAVFTDTTYTPSSSNPAMNGTASPGSSEQYSRGDHVHPSDSSKFNVAGGTVKGNILLNPDGSAVPYLGFRTEEDSQGKFGYAYIRKNASATVDYGTWITDFIVGDAKTANTERVELVLRRNASLANQLRLNYCYKDENDVMQSTTYNIYGTHNKPTPADVGLNRTNAVNVANTNYTTLMARGESLNSTETTPAVNGAIAWQYE